MGKTVKMLGMAVLGVVVLLMVAAAGFFYVAEVRADKSFVTEKQTPKSDPLSKQKQQWTKVPNKKDVSMKTDDGLNLKGQYIPAARKTNKTAIVIHGFSVDHREVIPYANLMHNQGYNVLLTDNRSAGASQGSFIGYGYLEAKDYMKWIKRLAADNPKSEIVVYGTSLGGATTMILSGMNPPKQVKAFIEDCGYTSVRDELVYEANSLYNIPKWLAQPIISIMSVYSKIIAGYSYGQADAVKAVRRNDRPMLFIHGAGDDFVPSYMLDQVYHAANGPKEKLLVPNADHMEAYRKDVVQYEQTVDGFLNRYVH